MPRWILTGGTISFSDRETGELFFAEEALEFFEQTNDIVDIDGLVAHEFWHHFQLVKGFHIEAPQVREVNARRFAKQMVMKWHPGRLAEFNFQPIEETMRGLPREPGIALDFQAMGPIGEIISNLFPNATPEEFLFLNESFNPKGKPISTAMWVRFKFLRDGPNWSYQMWQELKAFLTKFGMSAPQYSTIKNLFWVLHRKLDFIRFVEIETSDFIDGQDRNIYEINPDHADRIDEWRDPIRAVYGREFTNA